VMASLTRSIFHCQRSGTGTGFLSRTDFLRAFAARAYNT
jgi:hypothetical protein